VGKLLKNKIFVLGLLLLLLASVSAITVERIVSDTVIAGETVNISLKVNLEGESPSSLIVTETIPSGWEFVSSEPKANDFEGEQKWLLYGNNLQDSMTLKYSLKAPLGFSGEAGLSGDWKTLANAGMVSGDFVIAETQADVPPNGDDDEPPPPTEQPDYIPLIIGAVVVIIIAIIAAVVILKKKQ